MIIERKVNGRIKYCDPVSQASSSYKQELD